MQSAKAEEQNATRLSNQKDADLRHVTDELGISTTELAIIKDDNSRLTVEASSLQRSLDSKLVEKADLVNRSEAED